ncbi:MAG TPA: hypothetical protein VF638_16455 [Sphingomonas sp.]|jgi:hypothetical protein
MNNDKFWRPAWWTHFVKSAFAIACSRVIGSFLSPVDDVSQNVIVVVASIAVAGTLAVSIYRFARM